MVSYLFLTFPFKHMIALFHTHAVIDFENHCCRPRNVSPGPCVHFENPFWPFCCMEIRIYRGTITSCCCATGAIFYVKTMLCVDCFSFLQNSSCVHLLSGVWATESTRRGNRLGLDSLRWGDYVCRSQSHGRGRSAHSDWSAGRCHERVGTSCHQLAAQQRKKIPADKWYVDTRMSNTSVSRMCDWVLGSWSLLGLSAVEVAKQLWNFMGGLH